MSNPLIGYDKNYNIVHLRISESCEALENWKEYDENNNEVYSNTTGMGETWQEYDENNNLIHFIHSSYNCSYPDYIESWHKYDKNNNEIYFKNNKGSEYWCEFDENNNRIHYKNSNGFERWYKQNENNYEMIITQQEFKQIERNKVLFNNKKVNRFEIMDI